MKIVCLSFLLLLISVSESGAAPIKGQFSCRIHQPSESSEHLLALIEIPMGSANKYELDESTGLIILDRVMSMPVVYPVNYGLFPQTLAGDGDSLDVLLLSREPIHPGVLVMVRPIGVLRMLDGGEEDHKILCVPVSEVDPTYSGIQCTADLAPMELERMEAFFRVYKDLPSGGKRVELSGFGDAEEAMERVRQARQKWQKQFTKK